MKHFFIFLLFFCAFICPARAEGLSGPDLGGSPLADLVRRLPADHSSGIPFDGVYHSDHFVQMQNLGSDALVCRLHLFRHAQKTLDILTYIWNEDATGRFMMREAVKAAQRGVKVRILIDTIGTPEDIAMIAYFASAHPDLELRIYNPVFSRVLPSKFVLYSELFLKFRKFNQRMHTKLLIADGIISIIGGRNFGDEYYDVNDGHNFKDRDLLVAGPMLDEMKQSFEEYWRYERSVPAADLVDVKRALRNGLRNPDPQRFYDFGDTFDVIDRRADDEGYVRRRFVDTAFRVDHLMLMIDPPGKTNRRTLRHVTSRATLQLLSVVSQARESIIFQSPYFLLNARAIKYVREHLKKYPDLDMMMLTNSLAATDSVYAYAYAFKQHKTYINDLGIRVFEMKPVRTELYTLKYNPAETGGGLPLQDIDQTGYDPYLAALGLKDGDEYGADNEPHMSTHAKSFVIDDRIGWVGSTNLDSRSLYWNTEIGIAIWDEDFARALKRDMLWDASPANSWVVARRKKGWNFLRRASEPTGTLMEYIPVLDFWPFHYTSSFDLKKGKTPVASDDPVFYDHYRDVGSFPLVSPMEKRRWRLRGLKSVIGAAQPVL